ncbi:PP2C family protein-serine/threonine phosphatase [Nocardioides sp. CPCC 205120]|uniref:PP2C family protein-serine/threonine phosphatase n=1 Tax=Nocardioides sp. CPCC 205120 TaxID=3406462 RepID=UPI003B50D2BF
MPSLPAPIAATSAGPGPDFEGALEHVRTLMGAQTATLLLLDEASGKLRTAASLGFGRRWRTASYVSLGQGFAGRVAATRRPVAVDRAAGDPVVNPVLKYSEVTSLLGVPVLSGEELLGVLHVGFHARRTFSAQDVADLELAAASISRTVLSTSEHDAHLASLVLQRSLLPTLRDVDGLELAARYLPADGDFGGDWYDVFSLPDGRLGLVMGDVVGHGLQAAVVMSRLRSALRAYALDEDDPAAVLTRLDRMLCHFEPGMTATVVYAVTEPPFDHLVVSSAGHLPPVGASPGAAAAPVDVESDTLLGLDPATPRTTTAVALAPGGALAFFTDGLVEIRTPGTEGDDPYWTQLARICRGFSADEHPEVACSRILAEALGDEVTEDDVALLVVRRPHVR